MLLPLRYGDCAAPRVAANRQLLDAIQPDRISDARPRRYVDRTLCRDLNFRLDDVFAPVALARGGVPRQREALECGHGDVVRAPDAGLEHSAAPHRDAVRPARLLDALRFRVSADAAQLY